MAAEVVPRCRRCNRRLKNPESIKRGIGTTCRNKNKRTVRVWRQQILPIGPEQMEFQWPRQKTTITS